MKITPPARLAPRWCLPAALLALVLWQGLASLPPHLPGPLQLGGQLVQLLKEHKAEQDRERTFYQAELQQRLEQDADADPLPLLPAFERTPTFFDQLLLSLQRVLAGFALTALLAVPAGLLLVRGHRRIGARPGMLLSWLLPLPPVLAALLLSPLPGGTSMLLGCILLGCLAPALYGVARAARGRASAGNLAQALLQGLRLPLALAWLVLLLAEMALQSQGLGHFILTELGQDDQDARARALLGLGGALLAALLLDRLLLGLGQVAPRP
ncbi:hypothetical protein [Zobellella iuensis]|uniref:ABC transmembrane type-1 domain-containing protein n=1 Tax=Zobellella iuensis TaxID=2803811 RepID=A0ABS1QXR9_9GAMM|nr:hypothetical protein [Zobellella iuensis]MBL1379536.1 hypothetical protein [Zobellella iuensis]